MNELAAGDRVASGGITDARLQSVVDHTSAKGGGIGGSQSYVLQIQQPPAEKSIDFVDAIPWTVASIGILASLGWNWFNYVRTTSIQQKLRQQQIMLEEFRRLREMIDEALASLMTRAKELRSASAGITNVKSLRDVTRDPEKAVSEAYVELQDQLTAADKSAYASSTDWLTTVEPHWEAYAERIFDFRQKRTVADARIELDGAVGELANIRTVLNQRLDREISHYADQKKR